MRWVPILDWNRDKASSHDGEISTWYDYGGDTASGKMITRLDSGKGVAGTMKLRAFVG